MIVTFYSYKGGVGRSMALVNVAEILADAGYRVVVCDFDLEAPGLERYFADDPEVLERYRSQAGVVDLLEEYKSVMATTGAADETTSSHSDDHRYTSRNGVRIPRPSGFLVDAPSANVRRRGSVSLLTAGRRDGKWSRLYSERVQQFDWENFYASWAGDVFFDFFRQDLTDDGAVVLLDSRTGVTEQGGVCTHHLADLVVLLSAANDLNIDGTRWMAEVLASDATARLRRGRPLKVLPVAARIEVFSQVAELESFRERFLNTFRDYVPVEAGDPVEFIGRSEIPYVPFYAFTERIVARQDEVKQRELYGAYQTLAQGVVAVGVTSSLLAPPREGAWPDAVLPQPRTEDDVEAQVQDHREWLGSGGKRGRRAMLHGSDLRQRQLPGVHLRSADLSEARLELANLHHADLRAAMLVRALLTGADLTEAVLDGADLTGADLTGARLERASLNGAKLRNADLGRADLAFADLRNADLTLAKMEGADLRGARLDEAVGLATEHLQLALTDDATSTTLRQERPPVEGKPSAPRLDAAAQIWNVPSHRSPFFTGRDLLLQELRGRLATTGHAARRVALVGLGGVGKTQLAVEYAYRRRDDYDLVWWVRGDEPVGLMADYAALADEPPLAGELRPTGRATPEQAATAVRGWLEEHEGWLLVLDNVDDPLSVGDLLPRMPTGEVVITSSTGLGWEPLAAVVPVEGLAPADAASFLLARTGESGPAAEAAAGALATMLGGLPLALEQAGAFVTATGTTLTRYAELFDSRAPALLARGQPLGYADTVATVWSIALDRLRDQPAAVDLLTLVAFLAPDDLPWDLLAAHHGTLPEALAAAVGDPLAFADTVAALRQHSLIRVIGDGLHVHRLLQTVVRESLDLESARSWAAAAVRLVQAGFPYLSDAVAAWPECQRLLPHALIAVDHGQRVDVEHEGRLGLLNRVAVYLSSRGRYQEAVALLEEVIVGYRQLLGDDHPNTLTAMANLATTYQALGDPQRARELNEQALAGRLQVFGHDHPDTLTIMANLATNLWAHGENPAGDDPFDDHPGTIRLKIDPAYPERGERWTILGSSERARDRGPVARGQGPQQGDRVTQGEGDITKSPRNP